MLMQAAGADSAYFGLLLVFLEDLGASVFSLAVLGRLENGWVLTAAVCLSAEPTGPRSWRYFHARPELGIRKSMFRPGLSEFC